MTHFDPLRLDGGGDLEVLPAVLHEGVVDNHWWATNAARMEQDAGLRVVDSTVFTVVGNRGVSLEPFGQSFSDGRGVSWLSPLGQRQTEVALLEISSPDAPDLVTQQADLIHGVSRNEVVETPSLDVDGLVCLDSHERV